MDWHSLTNTFPWHPPLLAQLTPNETTTQIDVLKQQLEFLAKENARLSAEFTEKLKLASDGQQQLSESFKTSVEAIKSVIYFVGILSGGAIAFLTFWFGKTAQEAETIAKNIVNQRIEERMSAIADARIEVVKRSLQREVVIDQTQVDYWLFGGADLPREAILLEDRGFPVEFRSHPQRRGKRADVVVVDLNNWQDENGRSFGEFSQPEKEAELKRQIDQIPSRTGAIVVYAAGRYDYLDEVGKVRLVAPTNNPVTLVGMVVDAAYLVRGMG